MKALMVLFFFAMVVCAMSQYHYGYNYGYNTYTPGARVSHYASSAAGAGYVPYAGYNYAAYPYRYY